MNITIQAFAETIQRSEINAHFGYDETIVFECMFQVRTKTSVLYFGWHVIKER
jgi:hypothetical protein